MKRQFHTRNGGCGGMVSIFLLAIILTGLWVLMA